MSRSRLAERLIREAEDRIDSFLRERPGRDGFIASDYRPVAAALSEVALEADLARGAVFCEWGSGFGVVTLLAALYDLDAYGIEIQEDLVSEAEGLAADFDLDVSFGFGSFLPAGVEDLVQGQDLWCDTCSDKVYEELGIEPAEIDIFFAYPWPGEDKVVESVFRRCAQPGARLLTYRGGDVVLTRRKD